MSRRDVEVVERLLDAWRRRDVAALASVDPDIEIVAAFGMDLDGTIEDMPVARSC